MHKLVTFSKFCQNRMAKNTFKNLPGPSKFRHFLHFRENFASPTTLGTINQ